MISKNKLKYPLIILIFIGLMSVFSVNDLSISQKLANSESSFALFFSFIGEFLGWACFPLFPIFLIRLLKKSKYYYLIIFLLLFLAAAIYFYYFYVRVNLIMLNALFISLMLVLLILALSLKINKETIKRLLPFLITLFALILTSTLVVNILKIIFGRVRFRHLYEDFSNFSYWFIINGNNSHKSFPSGHTAAASVLVTITLLPSAFPKIKKFTLIFWIVSVLFAFLVALSRIILKAHYASDVTFSFFLTLMLFFLIRYINNIIFAKYANN